MRKQLKPLKMNRGKKLKLRRGWKHTIVPSGCVHRDTLRGSGHYIETDSSIYGPCRTQEAALRAAERGERK